MNPDVAVHQLGDIDIASDTGKHVSVVLAQAATHQKLNRLAHGGLRSHNQILVGGHGNPVSWCFAARPRKVHILPHDYLECANQRSLKCRNIDFTISLTCVSVTDLEERTACEDGNVKSRTRYEFLVVQIAGVNTGRRATEPSERCGRSHTDAAKEWVKRNIDSIREVREHKPDLLTLDLTMPGGSSLAALPSCFIAHPTLAVAILTMREDPEYARQALRAGARSYVLKEAEPAELLQAFRLAVTF